MKFELVFFGEGEGTFTRGPEAYIGAIPLTPYPEPDSRSGHFLLTNEICSAEECHKEIDKLIADLNQLKKLAIQKLPSK
jgi:hypothetical protein